MVGFVNGNNFSRSGWPSSWWMDWRAWNYNLMYTNLPWFIGLFCATTKYVRQSGIGQDKFLSSLKHWWLIKKTVYLASYCINANNQEDFRHDNSRIEWWREKPYKDRNIQKTNIIHKTCNLYHVISNLRVVSNAQR